MAQRRQQSELPACYGMTPAGLEPIAADEITRDFGGEVKKAGRGLVVFRVPTISQQLLQLRTIEDVFLLAWGSDALTYRSSDLDQIESWTAREGAWDQLLQLHHGIRPKPKGKPTWHVVTQMQGEHGYRRADARKALLRGLAGKVPSSWRLVEEGAALEIWLTIMGRTAICGVRLSDATMRHRTYKLEHRRASLRPVVAAAMARLAGTGPDAVILDPACGGGTILAEHLALSKQRGMSVSALGGDLEWGAITAAAINMRKLGMVRLCQWDAGRLPLASESVDRVLCNPPFGQQLGTPAEVQRLYRQLVSESNRVLKPAGRTVLLVGEPEWLRPVTASVGWSVQRELRVKLLGNPTTLGIWRKPG